MTTVSLDDYFAQFRNEFDLPEGVIYLDGNSLGALPRLASIRVQSAVANEWGNDLIRAWNSADWINAPARVGNKIAKLIGANDGEVVACDSTSINLFKALLSALALQANDSTRRVIVSDIDNFPTDLYIAQGLREIVREKNLELRFVKRDEMMAAIREDVAVVMLTEVDYRTGERYDMRSVTAHAQKNGAIMLWDLAHSTGAFPVALNACNADFAVGCGYKYLNGGPGAPAFIFAAERHLEALDAMNAPAPIAGWFAHASPFTFEPEFRVSRGVKRFLVGTPPILQMAALEGSLDLWLNVDLEKIRAQSLALTDLFIHEVETRCGSTGSPRARAGETSLSLATPPEHNKRGSQVSFRHPEGYAIMQALIARNVIGDFRAPDILRFGFTPLYVTRDDVINAATHLAEILETRAWDQPKFKQRNAVT